MVKGIRRVRSSGLIGTVWSKCNKTREPEGCAELGMLHLTKSGWVCVKLDVCTFFFALPNPHHYMLA